MFSNLIYLKYLDNTKRIITWFFESLNKVLSAVDCAKSKDSLRSLCSFFSNHTKNGLPGFFGFTCVTRRVGYSASTSHYFQIFDSCVPIEYAFIPFYTVGTVWYRVVLLVPCGTVWYRVVLFYTVGYIVLYFLNSCFITILAVTATTDPAIMMPPRSTFLPNWSSVRFKLSRFLFVALSCVGISSNVPLKSTLNSFISGNSICS